MVCRWLVQLQQDRICRRIWSNRNINEACLHPQPRSVRKSPGHNRCSLSATFTWERSGYSSDRRKTSFLSLLKTSSERPCKILDLKTCIQTQQWSNHRSPVSSHRSPLPTCIFVWFSKYFARFSKCLPLPVTNLQHIWHIPWPVIKFGLWKRCPLRGLLLLCLNLSYQWRGLGDAR